MTEKYKRETTIILLLIYDILDIFNIFTNTKYEYLLDFNINKKVYSIFYYIKRLFLFIDNCFILFDT